MYCGCNPIARASQLQTAHALIRLMAQKPYASVTVSELCRTAGISRQTFYSLFGSMENVVLFVLQEKACELPCGPEPGDALERLCRCYSRYICRNRDLLKLLVDNNVGFLLYRSVYEAVSRLGCREGTEWDYAANFVAGGITGVVRQYCAAEPPADCEELYRILCRLFQGGCFS